mmetsp:Transcript_30932/g.48486  ORF Transcript_30932/g.48486 Transcript_30932/m.48486 type:complete len:441 (-) Transcript_30932:113-1435(-)|eukprot:CAMPEP_0184308146 /NCGR_PEP_ID=MMETSP1049-20130417/16681_1 /TAXON_ID=77928 /ORGANISM="Proteomonas sulcata, Strain CCMP704" /LENGTH=440 /DNA_ID=CAMNT_0026620777 /DNA_START=248 /DNA_END=1570 /DNA_ORIENTATION=+
MALFASQRTHNNKGVTIPSQQRYIRYFAQNLGQSRPLANVRLNTLTILSCPSAMGKGLVFKIANGQVQQTIHYKGKDVVAGVTAFPLTVECEDIELAGDVQIKIFRQVHTFLGGESEEKVCSFWFHTSFIEYNTVTVCKKELDGPPRKDKQDEKFPPDFAIRLLFTPAENIVFRVHHPASGITGVVSAKGDVHSSLSRLDLTLSEESLNEAIDSAIERSISNPLDSNSSSSTPFLRCASGLALTGSMANETPLNSLDRSISIPEELGIDGLEPGCPSEATSPLQTTPLQSLDSSNKIQGSSVASMSSNRGCDVNSLNGSVVGSVGKGSVTGSLNGDGLFSFTRNLSVNSPHLHAELPGRGEAIMLFDFQPSEDELTTEDKGKYLCLRANDTVKIIQKSNKGWWMGEFCNQTGWFPARYCVEIVERDEADIDQGPKGETSN